MLTFVSKMTVPPGGLYFYLVEQTGAKFSHPSMAGCMALVKAHMKANNIPVPPNLEEVIEDYICHNVPGGFCTGSSDRPRKRFLSFTQIREGTRIMWQKANLKSDEFFVPVEEADRRALVCANCPKHVHDVCTSCTSDFASFLRALLAGRRKSKYDELLDTCGVCGCLLKAKVHLSVKALAVTQKHEYPDNCWLRNTPCDANYKEGEKIDGQ